jgi:hypothetical protein
MAKTLTLVVLICISAYSCTFMFTCVRRDMSPAGNNFFSGVLTLDKTVTVTLPTEGGGLAGLPGAMHGFGHSHRIRSAAAYILRAGAAPGGRSWQTTDADEPLGNPGVTKIQLKLVIQHQYAAEEK